MSHANDNALDRAAEVARAALGRAGAPQPCALLLLATGAGQLPGRLERAGRTPLSRIAGVPECWSECVLHWGELRGLPVWMLDDAARESGPSDPAWHAAFPVWLAASAGASTLIHTSAGAALAREEAPRVGTLALARDHVNLSGTTPLLALGESRLGPLFPDQTQLHDGALRRAALDAAREIGVDAREVVVACSLGPALETPAERAFFARAGADVSVQRLATPLLAAAHAGLGVLAIIVVVQDSAASLDLARITSASRALAPALDDLLWEIAASAQVQARAQLGEAGA
jgi:purine nucleoside phosphorylase